MSTFHNKPIRPPKRFINGTYAAHVKKRTPYIYREALDLHRHLDSLLEPHQRWINTDSLPFDGQTLAMIDHVLDDSAPGVLGLPKRNAIHWLNQFLLPDVRLSALRANGNLQKFRELVDKIERFNGHIHFGALLGPDFRGMQTNWNELHTFIGYSQSIQDVVQNPAVSASIVTDWHLHGERFYALARKSAVLSQRITKLSKLLNRAYPPTNDPVRYLHNAQKLVLRLGLWLQILQNTPCEGDLTPSQVLANLIIANTR